MGGEARFDPDGGAANLANWKISNSDSTVAVTQDNNNNNLENFETFRFILPPEKLPFSNEVCPKIA